MKVAALYDVHGMPHALGAVLAAVEAEGAELVLFGGDLLYGPFPERVLERVWSLPAARFVRGNCEREPNDWDRARVDPGDLQRLAGLPLTASVDGVLYCHATPTDDMPITTAETPDDVVAAMFAGVEEELVVIGHTHHQFDRRVDGVRVVNAGSVGMPYEGEVAAFWTMVEDGEPSFRRTAFDVDLAVAEIRASGWPGTRDFVAENLLAAPTRAEAIAQLEARRA